MNASLLQIKEKLQKLIKQHQQLQKENEQLKKEVEKREVKINKLNIEAEELHQQIDGLKLKGTTLQPQEKLALQKRIDKYLKEVDVCLQLISKE